MRYLFVMAITFFTLSACADRWDGYVPVDMAVNSDAPVPVESVIATGDVIAVHVYGESDLSGEYSVTETGHVVMPLGGNILVAGLTPLQAADAVTNALQSGGYLVDPAVTVTAALERHYSIVGEVMQAGEYAYRDGMSVLDAVAKGGGFTYRANEDDFEIIRKDKNGKAHMIQAGLATPVGAGDVIRVRERFF